MPNPENEELEERSEEQKEPKIPTRGIFVFRIDPNKRGVAFKIFIAGILALVLFSVVDTTGKFFTTTLNPQNCGTQIINTAVSRAKNRLILVCDCNDWGDQPKKLIAQLLQVAQSI